MAISATTTFRYVTVTSAGASATADPTSDPAPSGEKRAPIWISIFILFGALTGLILLFFCICWVARRVMIPGFSPTRPNSPDAEALAHAHAHARGPGNGPASPRTPAPAIPAVALEAIARKVAQLDKSAPITTYKAWLAEYEGEGEGECVSEPDEERDDDAVKGVARASSYVVCVVCLETLEDSDLIRTLPCRHIYHSECITQWFLNKHDTCPLCKVHYVPQDKDDAALARPPAAAFRGHRPYDAMYRLYTQVPI
ncbi:hypothetical protein D7B24_005555 [Verticillium nonalfalfae]|uniref:RING-type domain-containing protein n=1 Tax=Verticillium nonalfalfae TaxID=1051616 RepID=A0A3M9YCY3_9PEZI|nr:uncharacterized protein D7B24_005555 [Verticillium nonalfalfae]RNJ57762.1 hypothetical protein D7B24_005555 [Verticillium nonalfalfae]